AFGVRRVMAPDWSPRAGSDFDWGFGFHGQFLDGETGYYNYGYRYYIPWLGRWLNRDPIGERGGLNLYGFVNNDGVNDADYLGLTPPVYNPSNWNDNGPIQNSNNCYSYACDQRKKGPGTPANPTKPQPGDDSGRPPK